MLKSISFLFALFLAAAVSAQTTVPLDSFVTKSGVVHKMQAKKPKYF